MIGRKENLDKAERMDARVGKSDGQVRASSRAAAMSGHGDAMQKKSYRMT